MADADVTPALLDADLAEQWDAVVDWLRTLDDEVFDTASPLPGWRVRDLVAHLGEAMGVLERAEPADGEGAAREQAEDPVAAVEERGAAALAHLARLRSDGVAAVRVRRGVVPLDQLVTTRLVELVVHADDLSRSAHVATAVDPTARTIVADALAAVVRRRSGSDVEVEDERAWVRLATGRLGWDQRGDALRSGNLAEGLPDLRAYLPLV